jgi:L-arabinose isomerase
MRTTMCLLLALLLLAGAAASQTTVPPPTRVGVFGIGLDTYWGQFKGLKPRLEGYLASIEKNLTRPGIEVVSGGLVDNIDKARDVATLMKTRNVRIVFLYVSTYALSSTVLPVVRDANVPVIILNLQPDAQLDYAKFNALGDRGVMTGEWLAWCQACAVPEVANVCLKAGLQFHPVTGTLNDPASWAEVGEWLDAVRVADVMRSNRMGILGHYYNGMLDVYSDAALQSVVFGTHIEHLEIDQIKVYRRDVKSDAVKAKIREIRESFRVLPECTDAEVERAAKTACALDHLVVEKRLGSLAYYYEGSPGSEEEDIVTSVIAGNSLLTAHHVPVAGECEVKNVQAMKIMDAFGAGGSFSEFYLMDFKDDVVLLGHDGPGHIGIAEGKPILRPLGVFHGKPGNGLSVEMKVKNGPVTILAVVQTPAGKIKLLTAEGESVPGPIMEIGNTNSRYRFPCGARAFVDRWSTEGPAHHCAIGTGHIASRIKKLATLVGAEFVEIR